MFKLDSSLP